MKQEVLALIPARGGSKSIPRKNLLEIAGKPLIAHSIEQALQSRHVTRTVVTTDDPEIARVAREFGAETPFLRPAQFAQDLSPDIEAFSHALRWLRENEGYQCDLVLHLRPTGPVRRIELIDQAIELMFKNADADSLRSVSKPLQTPYKMWRIDQGLLRPLLTLDGVSEPYSLPRQSLPEVYWQNGYVDIVRAQVIEEGNSMCGQQIIPFVVNEPMLEIDYREDVAEVEAALLKLKQGLLPKSTSEERYSV